MLVEALQVHCVTRHTSHVTRHTSHVTRHTSHVTRHTSNVTRHSSYVTRHTSHVTRHICQAVKPQSDEQLLNPTHPVFDAFLRSYDARCVCNDVTCCAK
jgi:hypothetical protein